MANLRLVLVGVVIVVLFAGTPTVGPCFYSPVSPVAVIGDAYYQYRPPAPPTCAPLSHVVKTEPRPPLAGVNMADKVFERCNHNLVYILPCVL